MIVRLKPKPPSQNFRAFFVDSYYLRKDDACYKNLVEFLESCAQGYEGKLYSNSSGCVAIMSSNKGLVNISSNEYIVQTSGNAINVYKRDEFADLFEIVTDQN